VTEMLKNAHISSRPQFLAFRRRRLESDGCAQKRSKEDVNRVSTPAGLRAFLVKFLNKL
jgi:hypothetical protein